MTGRDELKPCNCYSRMVPNMYRSFANSFVVECPYCTEIVASHSKELAISEWNRRMEQEG